MLMNVQYLNSKRNDRLLQIIDGRAAVAKHELIFDDDTSRLVMCDDLHIVIATLSHST